jgi:hypothetical protein
MPGAGPLLDLVASIVDHIGVVAPEAAHDVGAAMGVDDAVLGVAPNRVAGGIDCRAGEMQAFDVFLVPGGARATPPGGRWGSHDYYVMSDGNIVGRIFRPRGAPAGVNEYFAALRQNRKYTW